MLNAKASRIVLVGIIVCLVFTWIASPANLRRSLERAGISLHKTNLRDPALASDSSARIYEVPLDQKARIVEVLETIGFVQEVSGGVVGKTPLKFTRAPKVFTFMPTQMVLISQDPSPHVEFYPDLK